MHESGLVIRYVCVYMCTFIISNQVVLAPSLLPLQGRRVNFSKLLCRPCVCVCVSDKGFLFSTGFPFFLLRVSSLYILCKNLTLEIFPLQSVAYLFSPTWRFANIQKSCRNFREHHTPSTSLLATYHLPCHISPAHQSTYFVMYFKVNWSHWRPCNLEFVFLFFRWSLHTIKHLNLKCAFAQFSPRVQLSPNPDSRHSQGSLLLLTPHSPRGGLFWYFPAIDLFLWVTWTGACGMWSVSGFFLVQHHVFENPIKMTNNFLFIAE